MKNIVDYEILVTLVVKKVYKARKHAVSEAVFWDAGLVSHFGHTSMAKWIWTKVSKVINTS